jgi:hypothetical protein
MLISTIISDKKVWLIWLKKSIFQSKTLKKHPISNLNQDLISKKIFQIKKFMTYLFWEVKTPYQMKPINTKIDFFNCWNINNQQLFPFFIVF